MVIPFSLIRPGPFVADLAQTEPNADARTFARTMRQLFVALMLEGFTEAQALQIIGMGIAASVAGQGGTSG